MVPMLGAIAIVVSERVLRTVLCGFGPRSEPCFGRIVGAIRFCGVSFRSRAVVAGGRTGGPALRFPARGFSLYRPSNVKNQVRAFFAIRRRMEMYGYRLESLRSLVRKLFG